MTGWRVAPEVESTSSRRRSSRSAALEATKKPWVKAEPSSHIWVARLPANLDAGTHCIQVRVTDEYGREHRDHLVLEVTAGEATLNVRG